MDPTNMIKAHVVSAATLLSEAAMLADAHGLTVPTRDLEAAVAHLQAAIRALSERTNTCPTSKH